MIIKNKRQSKQTPAIAIMAVGCGIAGLAIWLVQKSKNGTNGDSIKTTTVTTTTTAVHALPVGATKAVQFGDIVLYDYAPDAATSIDASVDNQALLAANDLFVLEYQQTIPTMGLASDAASVNQAMALKGFEITTNERLTKQNNINLLKQCLGEKSFADLKSHTTKISLALILDSIISLSSQFLKSKSNTLPAKGLSTLDKQRLSAGVLWSLAQAMGGNYSLQEALVRVFSNQETPIALGLNKNGSPSELSKSYVEAFLNGYFNCETAGYKGIFVIPALASAQIPNRAIPIKHLGDMALSRKLEPSYFNGVVFYEI